MQEANDTKKLGRGVAGYGQRLPDFSAGGGDGADAWDPTVNG